MIPELSHIESYKSLPIFVTTDGTCGLLLRVESCDLETTDVEGYFKRLQEALKMVSPHILVRLKTTKKVVHPKDSSFPRSEALRELGYLSTETVLSLECAHSIKALREILKLFKREEVPAAQFELLVKSKELFDRLGIRTTSLSEIEISDVFDYGNSSWVRSERSVETGTGSFGVIRLLKTPAQEFSIEDLPAVLQLLPCPFSMNVSFRRIAEAQTRILLERKLKQTKSSPDVQSQRQSQQTEQALLENFEKGSQLFEIEVLFTFERLSQADLTAALKEAEAQLSLFSKVMIETYGVAPSYIATMPGSFQHVTLYESEAALAALMPLWGFDSRSKSIEEQRTLSLHRRDRSVFHFDLFNPEYLAFNTLIVGSSGRGKSVLTGLLSSSLLNDPGINIIKLDVGGSHSKECELFGGREYQFSLSELSGINPFEIVQQSVFDTDKIAILSNFVLSLIREQGEVVLAKALRSTVEDAIGDYLQSKCLSPSLQDFFDFAKTVPRRDLLKRWVKGGVYEKAFASSARLGHHQLEYYNFSQIFQAADPEFAAAGIAAVLAKFNAKALSADGQRLVLICDETPFFIKNCFEFFKFTTANVRKFGHSVVLITQLSSELIVNGDTGIIENSPQRFLFSVDGDDEEFKRRFSLDDRAFRNLKTLKGIPGKLSEVLLQEDDISRRLVVRVTPEEYWRLTTSKSDREKLASLRKAVPSLSLHEAIACLSLR